jgi:hypothetical protein
MLRKLFLVGVISAATLAALTGPSDRAVPLDEVTLSGETAQEKTIANARLPAI